MRFWFLSVPKIVAKLLAKSRTRKLQKPILQVRAHYHLCSDVLVIIRFTLKSSQYSLDRAQDYKSPGP